MGIDKEILMNGSGYVDPTAYAAITNSQSNDITFADELKYIMKINKLTLFDVVDKCGYPEETLSRFLRGTTAPSFEVALEIFSKLGYTTEIFKDNSVDYIDSDMSEDDRFHKLLNVLFDICKLSGFHIEERIVVKDMRTGRVWR